MKQLKRTNLKNIQATPAAQFQKNNDPFKKSATLLYSLISSRDTDVWNSLLDSVVEGEGGMIWKNGIEACIISYI